MDYGYTIHMSFSIIFKTAFRVQSLTETGVCYQEDLIHCWASRKGLRMNSSVEADARVFSSRSAIHRRFEFRSVVVLKDENISTAVFLQVA